jgi:Flp pilus assembly protein TadD
LYEARGGQPSADTALARLAADTAVAGIVRATAVSLMDRYPTPLSRRAILAASRDPEPLVRLAAAGASVVLDPNDRWSGLFHLLEDSLLAVRVEAARVLAPVPDARMTDLQRAVAAAAFDEFVAAQRVNAERPEVHVRLGLFHAQRGRPAEAEHAYGEAIRLGPAYAGGYANLADLYREQGRDPEGERVLRAGLEKVHRPGILRHSLGLLLVRSHRLDEAVPELERAATLEPDAPRFALAYALALDAIGRRDEALTVLEHALERTPRDRELNQALAGLRGPRTEPKVGS